MQFFTSLLLFVAPLTLALPTAIENVENVETTAVEQLACDYQCGSVCYTQAQVNSAVSTGYRFTSSGSTAGGSSYPHRYNNYEGFNFPVSGPYNEFPLLRSGTYNGGSPGPDRVIYNSRGQSAFPITHTGASGNAFVSCN